MSGLSHDPGHAWESRSTGVGQEKQPPRLQGPHAGEKSVEDIDPKLRSSTECEFSPLKPNQSWLLSQVQQAFIIYLVELSPGLAATPAL